MTARVAINGFGRIGRMALRALFESGRTDLEIVAINDLTPIESNKLLLRRDSVHGAFPFDVDAKGEDTLVVGGKEIKVYQERNPEDLPWGELNIDIVMECTGIFTKHDDAGKHIKAGAKKVLISAPSPDPDLMVVYGVNSDKLTADHKIVSNASCTTNCLAPVAHALHSEIGIESGTMLTIHSYTGDQRTVDTAHKDPYRARAAAVNMIPTSTGAAKAVGKVLPELDGKLGGTSMRVPTADVSVVDLSFVPSRATTVEEVNAAVTKFATSSLDGVLGVSDEPLVSSDIIHNPLSSVFMTNQTMIVNGQVRIMSWYDNEWGFSNRMLDTAALMKKLG